jgi:hypothetical protein
MHECSFKAHPIFSLIFDLSRYFSQVDMFVLPKWQQGLNSKATHKVVPLNDTLNEI